MSKGAHIGRPREVVGVLHALIARATLHDRISEFARLLDVSQKSVHAWNNGERPNLYYQQEVNRLCLQVGLKPIYKNSKRKKRAA